MWLEPQLALKGRTGGMYQWMTLLANALDYQSLQATLTERQAQLQLSYERESALSQTVRELGSPVIPLMPGVLLVPLIGVIDSQRAQQIGERVLEAINAMQATMVLLDVTGVPLIDTQVANTLLQTARGAMLLGASVGLVGVRPEIAQSIVGLGIRLPGITAYATLASAIQVLQSQQTPGKRNRAWSTSAPRKGS
jgi:anti-anti-sigma regulatory factor